MYPRHTVRVSPWLAILLAVLTLVPATAARAQEAAGQEVPPAASTSAEIDAVIATIEDPESRERLLAQLRLLRQAQTQADAKPTARSALESATATALAELSDAVGEVGEFVGGFAGSVRELPAFAEWLQREATEADRRSVWLQVLRNLALVLGSGYLALFLARLLFRPVQARLAGGEALSLAGRALRLVAALLLDLLPVAAFALAAYAVLAVAETLEATRLVALVWINATIIVRVSLAVTRFLFAPERPGLRLLPMGDETAHYWDIWTRRLVQTGVYGYFALQAALLLGLPGTAYQGLLRLLGLLVAALALVLIVQNREPVARAIRGPVEGNVEVRAGGLRQRLAGAWHLLAVFYVLLLFVIWTLGIHGGFAFALRATVLTVVVLLLMRLVLALVARLFGRTFSIRDELRLRFPGLEMRTNRYLPIVHRVFRAFVYLVGAVALLEAWGIDAVAWLTSEPGTLLGTTFGTVLAIVVVTVVVWEVSSSMMESFLAETTSGGRVQVRSARTKTLVAVARNALLAVLGVVSTLLILSELGINIAPLLAGAGVVGLAVGFGAQTLVKDVITGALILFQDLIAVGQVIRVGDTAGLVEAVSIRTVRLRDVTGTVHTIPFSSISTISNLTKDFSFYVFDIGIAYREDADHVMEVLREIGAELQEDQEYGQHIIEPLEIQGVDKFADSAVIIRARIKTQPIKQWMVGREFNRRMKRRFDELGIEIPFPHQTVYFGVDKDGAAPPARVRMEGGAAGPGALQSPDAPPVAPGGST